MSPVRWPCAVWLWAHGLCRVLTQARDVFKSAIAYHNKALVRAPSPWGCTPRGRGGVELCLTALACYFDRSTWCWMGLCLGTSKSSGTSPSPTSAWQSLKLTKSGLPSCINDAQNCWLPFAYVSSSLTCSNQGCDSALGSCDWLDGQHELNPAIYIVTLKELSLEVATAFTEFVNLRIARCEKRQKWTVRVCSGVSTCCSSC